MLLALAAVFALMSSCQVKWNVDKMIDDYIKYQEEGNVEYAQKLFNKLVDLNKEGQMKDDQYYALEPYLTEEEKVLFDDNE